MIFGVGCDIIELQRFHESYKRHGEPLLQRIFLEAEIAYCNKFKDNIARFAARFAAKEAISKALGCGIGKKIGWHDIEISHDSSGRPRARLSEKTQALPEFANLHIHLSISHSATAALAYAVAEIVKT